MSRSKGAAILVVDDEPSVRNCVSRWLVSNGHVCEQAGSGAEALDLMERSKFALVITDIMMPGMSGIALLKEVRERWSHTAVIVLTGVDDRTTATDAVELGAYGYLIKPFEESEVLINVANALKRRRLEIMRDDFEAQLRERVRERTAEVRRTQEQIILHLVAASEYRDEDTGEHVRRIGLYSGCLAQRLGWAPERIDDMRIAAPMHDIGKIGISDAILLKPGRLTPEEFDQIKAHTTIGGHILAGTDIPLLKLARDIAMNHHEKWDGSGYPCGLAAETIPEEARIVAIADVYDSLTNDRVYRLAMTEEEALAIIRDGRGTHFDPAIFDVFMKALPEFRRIRRELADK